MHTSEKRWQELQRHPINCRYVIKERTPTKICGIHIRSLPGRTFHSFASGRVSRECAGRAGIFYVPDLIFIHERKAALDGV
jgi:hypothetical protein